LYNLVQQDDFPLSNERVEALDEKKIVEWFFEESSKARLCFSYCATFVTRPGINCHKNILCCICSLFFKSKYLLAFFSYHDYLSELEPDDQNLLRRYCEEIFPIWIRFFLKITDGIGGLTASEINNYVKSYFNKTIEIVRIALNRYDIPNLLMALVDVRFFSTITVQLTSTMLFSR